MRIASLAEFKAHIRELTNDLDPAYTLALDAATAEINAFVGYDVMERSSDDPPSDVVMACMLLAQVHADAGAVDDAEYRRGAAHRLLIPYRENTGIGAAA